MNTKLTMAAALLLTLPCALAQVAPAAPANNPTPAARPGDSPMGPGIPLGPGGAHGLRQRGPDGMGGDPRLLPPGTWWRNQDVVSRIGLSSDQQKHIDQIFLDSRVQLIHMHASLEEEQLRLDSALGSNPFNQSQALAEIDKIADTRASLEKANAKMLLNIRGVLSADQWTKLQSAQMGPRPPMGRPDGDRRPMGRGDRRDNFHRNGGPSSGAGAPPPAAE